MKLDKFDLDTYLLPFWRAKEVYHETLTFVGEEDEAPLLYPPTEIICARNFGLDTVYEQGKDFVLTQEGKIKRLKGSKMPYFPVDEFYSTERGQHSLRVFEDKEGVSFEEPRYFAFGEGSFITSRQVAISYRHASKFEGRIPPCKKEKLPKTSASLSNKQPIKIAFYGDSITVGGNASGLSFGGNVAPYMDGFDRMVVRRLEEQFGVKIDMHNGAVGGWNVTQGKEHFSERMGSFTPDLMILGFGMNGALQEVSGYKADTLEIIRQARERNPLCEVVLISTTLPNPHIDWMRNQPLYAGALYELEKELDGVVVADMTAMHTYLLTKKRFRDMTANNINHPNDFLIRVYAQVILQTISGI